MVSQKLTKSHSQIETSPEARVEGRLVETVPFQCLQCGECCSNVSIPVSVAKAEKWLQRPWIVERLKSTGTLLEQVTREYYKLPLLPNNYCVFLAEDKRCMIETREGRDMKPTECKRFPFAAIALPDGNTGYDASAACSSISKHLMTTFADIMPACGAEPTLTEEVFPERVPLTPEKMPGKSPGKTIAYQQYLSYLEDVRVIFNQPDVHPEMALYEAWQLLRELNDKSGNSQTPDFRFNKRWRSLIPLLWLRRPYGEWSRLQLLGRGTYHDRKIFGNISITVKALSSVSCRLFEPNIKPDGHSGLESGCKSAVDINDSRETARFMNAYLFNLLNRKVLLGFQHSLTGILLTTTVAYFLVCWYARVFAHLQDRSSVKPDDVVMAIRVGERYYTGHQPHFLEFFRTFRWPQWLLLLLYSQ